MKKNPTIIWRFNEPPTQQPILFIRSYAHSYYRCSSIQNLAELVFVINADVNDIQRDELAQLPIVAGCCIVVLCGIPSSGIFCHNEFRQGKLDWLMTNNGDSIHSLYGRSSHQNAF